MEILGILMQDLGKVGWAVILIVLCVIWRDLSNMRSEMVTKDGLTIALQTIRVDLLKQVGERFQSKEDAQRYENGNVRDHIDIRSDITELQREANRG